jgi:Ulp1 family protease
MVKAHQVESWVQSEEARYERVRKWTKTLDVFDMDYVLVPIHDHAHWSLAIICQPGVISSSALKTQHD